MKPALNWEPITISRPRPWSQLRHYVRLRRKYTLAFGMSFTYSKPFKALSQVWAQKPERSHKALEPRGHQARQKPSPYGSLRAVKANALCLFAFASKAMATQHILYPQQPCARPGPLHSIPVQVAKEASARLAASAADAQSAANHLVGRSCLHHPVWGAKILGVASGGFCIVDVWQCVITAL